MFYWFVSLLALVGVVLNIKKNVSCFYIWAITNAVWVYADIRHGILAQAFLQFIYFMLSIYGIIQWTRKTNRTSAGNP